MMLSERSSGRDNNFNLLRMIAASGVLVSHAYPISLGRNAIEPFEEVLRGDNLGRACVFVFFAISGFFITRSYAERENPFRFILARALRLFPALIIMALMTIFVIGVVVSDAPLHIFVNGAWQYFVTVVSFSFFGDANGLPGAFEANPLPRAVNGSLWTLKYEVLCYFGVLVAGYLGVFRRSRAWLPLFFIVLCGYFSLPLITGRSDILMLLYLGFPFAIGSALYLWRDRIPLSWGGAVFLILLTIICWWAPVLVFRAMFNLALAYVTFCIGYAKIPWLRAYNNLGDYSCGMYIYAFPIQQIVASSDVTTPWGNMIIAFPCALLCAVLSWHLVEKPAMRLSHKPAKTYGSLDLSAGGQKR